MRIDGPQITGSFSLNGDGVQDLDVFATTASLNLATASLATTGSNTFVGTQTIQGSIVPSANSTYDLGSPENNFRHLYLSSASLYIDGTKVLGSTSQELQITTDTGQSFKILEAGSDTITLQSADGNITLATSGGGDVILDPTTGVVALKGTVTIYSGNKIISSDGNAIHIGDDIVVSGSILSTGTPLISGSEQISSLGFATTGSNTFNGNLTVTGYIDAQELRTTYISSSILYRSGSTKFGDESTDTHDFTGSLVVSGFGTFTRSDDSRIYITDSGDNSTLVLRADATNEIYTNTNHDLQIYTNGNQNGQLFLKQSTNRVGIGETNPDNKLHVNSGTVNIVAKFESTDDTAGIALADSTGNVELTTSGTNGFNIQPGGGSTVFRVDGDGKTGIGTPTPGALLHINGDGDAIRITSTNSGAGGAQIDMLHFSPSPADNDIMSFINMGGYYSGTNSAYFSSIRTVATNVAGRNGELQFWTVNNGTLAKKAVINTNGWLGLGIDSPAAHLSVIDEDGGTSMVHVRNYNTLATGNFTGNYMVELRSAYATGSTGGALLVHTEESSNARPTMQVSSAAGVFATFTNGKVGIGETDPSDKLHITNTAGDAGILLEGPSQTLRIDQNSIRTTTTSPINIFTNSTSGANSLYIGNDGRFGVGTTTPTSGTKLDVAGKIRATDDLILSQTTPRIDYDGGNTGSLRFVSTSTGGVTMTLLSNGNLGIGEPTPTAKLVLSTPGDTVDGTYYSSFTLKNTGTSTVSRIRFDRGTSAKWGFTHWADDSFRLSNLDVNGTGAADDTTITILNNNNIGIGRSPAAKLDVNGNGIFRVGGSATNTGDFTITNDNCSSTVSSWSLNSTPIFFINSENTDSPHIGMNMSVDYADGPKIIGYKSRGSAANNISVLNGDDILSIQAWPLHTAGPNYYKFGGGMTWYKDDGGGTANTYAPVSLKWVMSNSTTTTIDAMKLSYDGILSINSGILFNGDTADANKLDDYEEGTWTPAFQTFSYNVSATYTDRRGTYTKIGNMVYVFFDMTASSITGTLSSPIITGLPYTVSDNLGGYSVAQWRDASAVATGPDNTLLKGFVNRNTNYIYLQFDNTGNGGFGTNSTTLSWNSSGRITGYAIYHV